MPCLPPDADPGKGMAVETRPWAQGAQPYSGRPERAPKAMHQPAQPRSCGRRAGRALGQELPWEGRHTCEECGQPQHTPWGSHTVPPPPRTPGCLSGSHRGVMPTGPLSTFPCLSFPRELTTTRSGTLAQSWAARPGQSQPGAASGPLPPSLPPCTPGPRRRHVLSPVECAKSLPDVHGGQRDPPALPPATGDPRAHPHGTAHPSPAPSGDPCPARPRLSRASRPRGPAALGQGSSGCNEGRVAWSPSRPGPAERGRAGSCPAAPAPVPGGSSGAERGCQMESGCRR